MPPSARSGQQAYEGARGAQRIRRCVPPGRTGCIDCFRENTFESSIADFVAGCRAPSERSGGARLRSEERNRDAGLSVMTWLKRDRGSLPSKTTVW